MSPGCFVSISHPECIHTQLLSHPDIVNQFNLNIKKLAKRSHFSVIFHTTRGQRVKHVVEALSGVVAIVVFVWRLRCDQLFLVVIEPFLGFISTI